MNHVEILEIIKLNAAAYNYSLQT